MPWHARGRLGGIQRGSRTTTHADAGARARKHARDTYRLGPEEEDCRKDAASAGAGSQHASSRSARRRRREQEGARQCSCRCFLCCRVGDGGGGGGAAASAAGKEQMERMIEAPRANELKDGGHAAWTHPRAFEEMYVQARRAHSPSHDNGGRRRRRHRSSAPGAGMAGVPGIIDRSTASGAASRRDTLSLCAAAGQARPGHAGAPAAAWGLWARGWCGVRSWCFASSVRSLFFG